VAILEGGVLLITPGVLSDVLGLFLLVPFTRRGIISVARRAFEARLRSGARVTWSTFGTPQPRPSTSGEPFAGRGRRAPLEESDAELVE
jgi:UPF0716 protein FxsA